MRRSTIPLITTLVVILDLTAGIPTIARFGLPGQPMYSGSGVGPLWLFRSSNENAQIVNDGLKGHPLARSLALAYGDEFPHLRDDIIRRVKEMSEGGTTRSGGILSNPYLGAAISPANWRLDRENTKKETSDPYKRAGLLSSLGGGGGGGAGGGILSSITGLASSFLGGGAGGASSSSSSSSSGSSSGFRITADSATRATPTADKAGNSLDDASSSGSASASILADAVASSTEGSRRRR